MLSWVSTAGDVWGSEPAAPVFIYQQQHRRLTGRGFSELRARQSFIPQPPHTRVCQQPQGGQLSLGLLLAPVRNGAAGPAWAAKGFSAPPGLRHAELFGTVAAPQLGFSFKTQHEANPSLIQLPAKGRSLLWAGDGSFPSCAAAPGTAEASIAQLAQ